MNGRTGQVPRLIVGISRSPASWWALAWAVGEARRRRARLLLVHVFRTPLVAFPDTTRDPYADRAAKGNVLIWTAIGHAAGRVLGDVPWQEQIIPGRPAAELASIAWGGDLLVLGSRHRGWLRQLAPGSVARACARTARS